MALPVSVFSATMIKMTQQDALTDHLLTFCLIRTCFLQGDDHGARAEGVPGGAVVGRVEVGLHDVVDGEGGEDGSALGRRLTLLHRVPLHQGTLLLLPHVLLPCPDLQHKFHIRVLLARADVEPTDMMIQKQEMKLYSAVKICLFLMMSHDAQY